MSEICGLDNPAFDTPKKQLIAVLQVQQSVGVRFPYNHSIIRSAYVLFSSAVKGIKSPAPAYAADFAAFIKAQGLGTVTVSQPRKNPNSRNCIRIYLWQINKPALAAWKAKHVTTTANV
jgi:hypothetical protein